MLYKSHQISLLNQIPYQIQHTESKIIGISDFDGGKKNLQQIDDMLHLESIDLYHSKKVNFIENSC